MTLYAGDRVDRYTILRLLGVGGMGEVYEAEDSKLRRRVALKLLKSNGDASIATRHRLLREARAVAALSHPNVLAIFDVGEFADIEGTTGLAYIAMEFVPGETVRARISGNPTSIGERVSWLAATAAALAAAHRAGLIHRDVKPENVMIRDDGVVKVLDFGIARLATAGSGEADPPNEVRVEQASTGNSSTLDLGALGTTRTAAGVVLGTPVYMAPEQLRGETLDGHADQFSWGVMAYEVITGRLPWTRTGGSLAIISQILSQTPPAPSSFRPDVPESLSRVIVRALAKTPADRFPSMDDLIVALLLAAGESPARQSAFRLSHKSRRFALLASSVALTAAVLASASLVQNFRQDEMSHNRRWLAVLPDVCATTSMCAARHPGEAWHCNSARHECVAVASPDCRPLLQEDALNSDETVWVGAMYPTSGPEKEAFASETRALQMARDDFAQALGANASSTGARRARPIGLVLCDETKEPMRAASHLAQDLDVPAVLGFRDLSSATRTISGVFIERNILSLITISQMPELIRLPQPASTPRLVWRDTLNAADAVPPLVSFLDDALARRHSASSGGRGRSARDRIALTRGHRPSDLADELFKSMQFNGKPAIENGDDFRQYVQGESRDMTSQQVVDSLVLFHPSAIFNLGDPFFPTALEPLEARWSDEPRPLYLVLTGEFDKTIDPFVGDNAERRRRFFGVTNVSSRMANAQLVLRYNTIYPDNPIVRTIAPQPSYDGMYTLAYAILSLGDHPITGPAISLAFDRLLPPGHPIDVGPEDITTAFALLRSGQNIDLNGAIGDLDYNRATGEAPIDYAIVCLNVDDRGFASGSVESGLVYDAKTKKLTGTMHCP